MTNIKQNQGSNKSQDNKAGAQSPNKKPENKPGSGSSSTGDKR